MSKRRPDEGDQWIASQSAAEVEELAKRAELSRATALEHATEAGARCMAALVEATHCGALLGLCREKLKHGEWQAWLENRFSDNYRTLIRWANLPAKCGLNVTGVSDLPTHEQIADAWSAVGVSQLTAAYRLTGALPEGEGSDGAATGHQPHPFLIRFKIAPNWEQWSPETKREFLDQTKAIVEQRQAIEESLA